MSVLTNYPKILRFLKFNFFKNDNFENTNFEKKLIKCNLVNEIIDRQIKDNERQCYYSCSEDDEVRVDTSIEYPCQPYIMEER
tara:strand:+ start:191 stop:439 length:249 start_codon:yes stop_codon:yes gene_type:complete